MGKRKVTLELTPLEANVTYAAVNALSAAIAWDETVDFLGSTTRAKALYRVLDKLQKIHS